MHVFPGVDLFDAPIDGFLQFDQVGIGIVFVHAVERFLEREQRFIRPHVRQFPERPGDLGFHGDILGVQRFEQRIHDREISVQRADDTQGLRRRRA